METSKQKFAGPRWVGRAVFLLQVSFGTRGLEPRLEQLFGLVTHCTVRPEACDLEPSGEDQTLGIGTKEGRESIQRGLAANGSENSA